MKGHSGEKSNKWLISRGHGYPARQHPESLWLFISHYKIVASQLQSNHDDVHWAFCPNAIQCSDLQRCSGWMFESGVWTVGKSCMHSMAHIGRMISGSIPNARSSSEFQGGSRTHCKAHQWYRVFFNLKNPGVVMHTRIPTLQGSSVISIGKEQNIFV